MSSRSDRTTAEWVTFAAACLVIAVLIGLIVTEVGGSSDPPLLTASAARARESGGRYYVPVEVSNAGDETAADVRVTAELSVGGDVAEGDQMLDFLAGGESRTVVFVFDDDPDAGTLEVAVTGYAEP